MANKKHKIILNDDGTVKSFMVKLPGSDRSFRCECACNCFHKYENEPNKYYCNSCDECYIGE